MKLNRRIVIIVSAILLFLLIGGVTLVKSVDIAHVKKQLSLGNKYLSEGKYEEAILAFQKVIKIEPRNIEARVGLAKVYVKIKRFKDAEDILKEAISINSKKASPYIELAKLYIEQDRLNEAIELLEKGYKVTKNDEIKKMLDEIRNGPEPPIASLESGSYKETKIVELKNNGILKGEIHYTLDGTSPTKDSSIYKEPINLFDGKTVLTAILIDSSGKLSKEAKYEYELDLPKTLVTFEDKEFEKMIRKILNKETGDIYDTELAKVEDLTIIGTNVGLYEAHWGHDGIFQYRDKEGKIYTERGKITNINDLKWFKNLKSLSINYNQIKDISVLRQLPQLTSISLDSNNISDISVLTELKGLISLYIGDNPIGNYSIIGNLSKLERLELMCSGLSSINFLSNLNNIRHLSLYSNLFSDLSPIRGMVDLEFLYIAETNVKDISVLKGHKRLKVLYISEYKITDKALIDEFKKLGILNNPIPNSN